ncbi:hypothetical protein IQ268_14340 [Oculatella sp. LEGE 06141]|nr:hypothetical protein [Oculatella sp. LEGE 06141]MBE9179745.1 hypothetical protein [Oculatella sp. LEGE 06141]
MHPINPWLRARDFLFGVRRSDRHVIWSHTVAAGVSYPRSLLITEKL